MNAPSTPTVRIASRKDFIEALAIAQAEVKKVIAQRASAPALSFISGMLDTMEKLTANGREPTPEERRDAKLGALVDRELQPPSTQEEANLIGLLLAVNLYFMIWPDDGIDPEEMSREEFLARL